MGITERRIEDAGLMRGIAALTPERIEKVVKAVTEGEAGARLKVYYETCMRCGLCAKNCPVNCISGSRQEPYRIDQEKCIRCGTCFQKCPFGAIRKS